MNRAASSGVEMLGQISPPAPASRSFMMSQFSSSDACEGRLAVTLDCADEIEGSLEVEEPVL
jgi:hypothetical protein